MSWQRIKDDPTLGHRRGYDIVNVLRAVGIAKLVKKNGKKTVVYLDPDEEANAAAIIEQVRSGSAPAPASSRRSRSLEYCTRLCVMILATSGNRTRDQLANETGFARQRICTLVGVLSAVGLCRMLPEKIDRQHVVEIVDGWSTASARVTWEIGVDDLGEEYFGGGGEP